VAERRQGPRASARVWAYLTEGTAPDEGQPGREEWLEAHFLGGGRALWQRWRAEVMARWIADRPGSRPWAWYEHDCPPREERLKLSGSGAQTATLNHDRRPEFHGCEAGAPPRIESEATFLRRLGVLEAGEEKRIPKRAWAPVRRATPLARCRRLIRWENGLLEETFRSQDREIPVLFQRTSQQLSELVLVELHLLPDEVGQMV
jgi:hypothetical protein